MTVYQDPPEGIVQPKPDYLYLHERKCRGCRATIYWWETVMGRHSPHDADGTSHFATCPKAQDFRKHTERQP